MAINPLQTSDTSLTFITPAGKVLALRPGEIARAEVIDVMESGRLSLRIDHGSGVPAFVMAESAIPLEKGDEFFLRTLAGKTELRFQFEGMVADAAEGGAKLPPVVLKTLLDLISDRPDPEAKKSDLSILRTLLKYLPKEISEAAPQEFFPAPETLDGKSLKSSIEKTGILFETGMKESLGRDGGVGPGPDLKALLLRWKDGLKAGGLLEKLRVSSYKPAEVLDAVGRVLKSIEYYQASSRLQDVIYTFLPLNWDDLKDGELCLGREADAGGEAYTCDIVLDLESVGKLAISVTFSGGAFFISFSSESVETAATLRVGKKILEERFQHAGLSLKAINVGSKGRVDIIPGRSRGINLKA